MRESDNISVENPEIKKKRRRRRPKKVQRPIEMAEELKIQDEMSARVGESSQEIKTRTQPLAGRAPDTVDAKKLVPDFVKAILDKNKPIKMPTKRYDRYYNMKHKKRGLAYIFSHENFDPVHNLSQRVGTVKDGNDLMQQLEILQFEVKLFYDQTFNTINLELEKAAKMDHKDHDCILICVMSHGENNLLYAQDTFYKPEMLWLRFAADKCPSLAGKPKIILLQACRGNKLDSGTKMFSAFDQTDGGDDSMHYTIPNHADFFIGYSTISDFYSWRNPLEGSWYIQSLVEVLKTSGTEDDFLTIMTLVSQKVAYDWESYTPDVDMTDKKKQIPCFLSMLTRLLKFEDKPEIVN